MRRLRLAEASAILIGTQIGAGVLGLPYALREAGVLGIFIVILAGLMTLLTALFVLEVSSKNPGKSLSKLSEEHLGKIGGVSMFLSISALAYGALIAYIAGSADILSSLTGVKPEFAALAFWILMSLIVFMGLKVSGEAELALTGLLLLVLAVSIGLVLGRIDVNNLSTFNTSAALNGLGVVIFAYVSHMVIPELLKGLEDIKTTTKAVFIGYLVPMVFYAFFVLSFVGAFGSDAPELATSALERLYGNLGRILGLVLPLAAICTSYIGVALSEMDNMKDVLGIGRLYAWLLTVLPPLLIYFAGLKSFVNALWLAGTFGGILYAGILPTAMYLKAKRKQESFHLNLPHSIAYLSGLIFLVLFLYSIVSLG
ncbi:amino acid permease [Thermococcus litoralis DSM 5473]|uniref:Amino acid permease n=1 Tax=Thermococcus litoralis (strain ATCC 51850 / DSM 5473 / JCM 8560 / NS-C) TaxID=523849 RepID=H3ZND4_THELN|nr:aromatic amino acid transport family protein [Thermococcus litoralis]EHR78558.1 amino acid permease [Thermococcus litoralis DSM 5473]